MRKFESKYGYFDEAAREYVITTPRTPRPWVNVICPEMGCHPLANRRRLQLADTCITMPLLVSGPCA